MTCVVSKAHVAEPFDLAPDEQAAFWLDVCSVARAVRDAVAASKINYEIHGNTIAHLRPGEPNQLLLGASSAGRDERGRRRLQTEPSPGARAAGPLVSTRTLIAGRMCVPIGSLACWSSRACDIGAW